MKLGRGDGDSDPFHAPVFKGRTFDQWLNQLEYELSVQSLGDAIRAVARLNTTDEQRRRAAAATIRVARRLGGLTFSTSNPGTLMSASALGASESPEQASPDFMAILKAEFPAYLPEPGLAVLEAELREGNRKSRLAAIFLIWEFLFVQDERKQDQNRSFLARECESLHGRVKLQNLVDALGVASASFMGTDDDSDRARGFTLSCAQELSKQLETPWNEAHWVSALLEQNVLRAVSKLKSDPNRSEVNPGWYRYDVTDLLEAHRRGRIEVPAELAAENAAYFTLRGYPPMSKRLDAFLLTYPKEIGLVREVLLRNIEEQILAKDFLASSGYVTANENRISGPGNEMRSVFEAIDFWHKAIDLLAQATEDRERAAESLEALSNKEIRLGSSNKVRTSTGRVALVPNKLRAKLEEAIKTLREG